MKRMDWLITIFSSSSNYYPSLFAPITTKVGFAAGLSYWYQPQSEAPTKSPSPTLQRSYTPSLTKFPSESPSLMRSDEPSQSPSSSFGPTVEWNESIRICLCDRSHICTNEPVSPNSPQINICLLSQPTSFILQNVNLVYIRQEGSMDHLLIFRSKQKDALEIEKSGLRRMLISAVVPDSLFDNPAKAEVKGQGTVQQTGTDGIPIEIDFSLELTLLSQPSDSPSTSPSASSNPTFGGPTERPTRSNKPSYSPSKSMVPTEEQTIGLESCQCDSQNICLGDQVTLTFTDRSIRICLVASPSNAEISVTDIVVKVVGVDEEEEEKSLSPRVQTEENTAIVSARLSDDFFDIGPRDKLFILGAVEIYVRQGNKRSEVGFVEEYTVEPLTAPPTDNPTISAAPTGVPPLGVRACQCDTSNVCIENAVQWFSSRSVRLCLISTPPESELDFVESLFIEMKMNQQSDLIETQSVISNKQAVVDASTPAATVVDVPNDKRTKVITTTLKQGFFRDDAPELNIKARGFARVISSDDVSVANALFEVNLQIVSEPTSLPSYYPTTLPPTNKPSSQPSKTPTNVSFSEYQFLL